MVETENFQPGDQKSNDSFEALITTKIVNQIESIRTKTSGPAIRMSRTLVYGLTAILIILISVPFLFIGISRGLIEVFDNWVFSERSTAVWFVYILNATLWSTIGLLIWKRRPKDAALPKKSMFEMEENDA
ncbi:MAG: hypothetical protein CL431_03150 [Acidimicrobiaceae bacterium]|jgi:hypothetical protein|nr:hypothetical protein [Acidimicrobiaceae bacterium]|tara:strand:- start:30658 stop:31050 length:393 start_codon:yes stop_codon:yes gene_type:complete